MNNNDRELFKKALSEAMAQKYDEELAGCEENAICSQKHYDKMQKIIGRNICHPKKRLTKKSLIAIIVAVALLLTGCTATYIYRDEIRDFVEEIYEEFIKLTYDDEEQNPVGGIKEQYELTYVPEGYEKTNEKITSLYIYYEYTNVNKDKLTFHQNPLDGSNFYFDNEQGDTTVYEYHEYKIYCRILDSTYHYTWNNGIYSLTINSSVALTNDELNSIVDGIRTQT
jgi:hypothetical protein